MDKYPGISLQKLTAEVRATSDGVLKGGKPDAVAGVIVFYLKYS